MSQRHQLPDLDRTDYVLALAVGVGGLAVYARTLAPDVLYSDSAEFQTLAYTLGMTHSTGYPVYLPLARLLGYLPLGTLAWRVNLLSAVSAAITLSAVFLLVRHVTRSRVGGLLGTAALGMSYTFWSQAVIAEVYAPGLAFLSVIALLLWHWQIDPVGRSRALPIAALLFGLGLGVHALVVFIAPVAALLVVWTLLSQRVSASEWRHSLGAAFLGLVAGIGIYLLAYLLVDINNPPSSFYQVALVSSRSIWGLQVSDINSPLERFIATVAGLQWQDAMFPTRGDDHFLNAIARYAERVIDHEFSPLVFLLAFLGLEVTLRRTRKLGVFLLVAFATTLFFVLNYEPPDKYIFYLPTYLFVAIAVGAAAGSLLDLIYQHLVVGKGRLGLVVYALAVAVLTVIVFLPVWNSRWDALRQGAATFVVEDYVYPLYDLDEPRHTATWQLGQLPENAALIMSWRGLYSLYYLAHVEGERPDIRIFEASPHGGGGNVADSLVQELKIALQESRPVYTDRVYGGLREHFRVQPALGGEWYRLSPPRTD